MADATPSRPTPQRKQIDGVVADVDATEVTPEVTEDVEADEAPATSAKPAKVKVPKVGEFNERGAQVHSVGKMWRSGAIKVEYK